MLTEKLGVSMSAKRQRKRTFVLFPTLVIGNQCFVGDSVASCVVINLSLYIFFRSADSLYLSRAGKHAKRCIVTEYNK